MYSKNNFNTLGFRCERSMRLLIYISRVKESYFIHLEKIIKKNKSAQHSPFEIIIQLEIEQKMVSFSK